MANDQMILVDQYDNPVGQMEKMAAHQQGCLHRAFSIFIVNTNGDMLLQRRALSKYHSGGLWTNACCSHPVPGEETCLSAQRRLLEEMGFSCELSFLFTFIYKSNVGNGLMEHELDHIFLGTYEGLIVPAPDEVAECRYWSVHEIDQLIATEPQLFTNWFKLVWTDVKGYLK